MKKQNHIFDEITAIFSQERLDNYLTHQNCHHNKNEALIAYAWNMELSKALYPALQVLEVSLRNALHNAITQHYKTEISLDSSFFYPKEKLQISQAKDKLQRNKKPITAGRVVAELSFGFWTSLFDVRYEHHQIFWPKLLKPVFPHLSNEQRTRSNISRELNRIRRLRNRIFHYEPIWHWKDLLEQHKAITSLITGLSNVSAHYLNMLDQFPLVYAKGKENIEKNFNLIFNIS